MNGQPLEKNSAQLRSELPEQQQFELLLLQTGKAPE
jgi:hypothetical protein